MTRDELSKVCGGTPQPPGSYLANHCRMLDTGLAKLESWPNATVQASDLRGAMTSLGCWNVLGASAQTSASGTPAR